jgi:hypothetical protein
MKFLLSAFLQLCCMFAFSQPCGTDLYRSLNFTPAYRNSEEHMNRMIYDYTVTPTSHAVNATLSIPVVFHIIHNNGPENISDSAIISAVNQVNLRFQNAAPYYDSTGHVINIEFCLATVD